MGRKVSSGESFAHALRFGWDALCGFLDQGRAGLRPISLPSCFLLTSCRGRVPEGPLIPANFTPYKVEILTRGWAKNYRSLEQLAVVAA